MEEKDNAKTMAKIKAERDLEILKKYHKKETKSVKKNIYSTFFNICFGLHSEITYRVF